ncbi:DUF456 domain-containing protein [Desulfonauticus submarinus]
MILFIYVFIFLLFLFWALNFLSLPGNWLMLISLGIVDYFSQAIHFGKWYWLGFVFLALASEIVEWVGQYIGGKKYGLSKKGNIAAIVGAIIGSILGVPFFFGFGAFIGALLGAYVGSLGLEYLTEKSWELAHQKAKGAFLGKALGLAAKLGLGIAILSLAIPKLLQSG